MASAGFGVEMWCTDRLRTGKYVSGRVALAQAIYRRLTTPRGTLRGGDAEQAYGIDLPGFVGRTAIPIALAALPGIIRAELLKDDRISDVVATVIADTPDNGLVTLTITIRVVAADEDEEFSLTLAASSATIELLGIAA
jgi:hypothetical protein